MRSLLEFSIKGAGAEAQHVENGKESTLEEVADKMLSRLTKDLQKSLSPQPMAQNLSISLAFACLLYLANEKNLKLEGIEDLSDVLVRQGDSLWRHHQQEAHTFHWPDCLSPG